MVLGKYKINKPLARLTKKNDRERERKNGNKKLGMKEETLQLIPQNTKNHKRLL